MNQQTDHVFIISAHTPNINPGVFAEKHAALTLLLNDLGFSINTADGQYRGEPEKSVIVSVPFEKVNQTRELLLNLATMLDQQAVLYSDNQRNTSLVFTSGGEEPIGKLISSPTKPDSDSFTKVDGVYYYTV